jgi:photosystem II stability/assembly factor-like uncharacterized protein
MRSHRTDRQTSNLERAHLQVAGGGLLRLLGVLCILSALFVPCSAHANGRYPKADQLQIAPDDTRFLAVRTTFGLLVSEDSGKSWDWVCERAVGYSGVQDPTLGMMAQGTIVASLAEGVARTADRGCNWAFSDAQLGDSPVIDLTVRKDSPSHALALVWDAQQLGYSSRILASADNGRSFLPYGTPIDPTVLVTTLDVAPTNPHRVYASGTRSADGVRSALLFASNDDGQHWTEYTLPFEPKLEQGVYIAAVDPEDADTVYLRTSSATVGRLLVSHDGGEHVSVLHSGSLLAFALSPDGKQLYFGGEDGLYSGLASATEFERRASVRVLCLAATADTLYACSDEYSGFTVGASSDDGFTFDPLLHLKTVRGPLPCSAAQCEGDWPLVRAQLGIPLPDEPDAGSDAGDGAGAAAGSDAGSAGTGGRSDTGGRNDAGSPSVPAQLTPKGSCAVAFDDAGSTLPLAALLTTLGSVSWRRRLRPRSRLPAK